MKRAIDIASIVGIILAFGLVVFGMVYGDVPELDSSEQPVLDENGDPVVNKGIDFGRMGAFIDPPSIAIVIGGTIGTLVLMFPLSQMAKVPKHLAIVFMPKQYVPSKYIETLVECARKARMSGLLALEEDAANMTDPFMKNGIQMTVDSVDPEKVKTQMESWLDNIDERHAQERSFYDKGAALAPAFGMIGTLIGLVLMLGNLTDIESVGPNMAVALLTTFYGSILANIIFAPISNKLRVRHDEEYLCMRIVCEGVQAIQAGENPNLIQDRLLNLLPTYAQKKYSGGGGDGEGGDGGGGKKKGKK